jgi:serine/threonine protein kinase
MTATTEKNETSFWAGDYLAEKKIGVGGMGEVWRGTQPKIKKQVAIKVLNKKLIDHEVTIARFKREALAVNTVRNRHIVDIFSTGELSDGRPYMVMEYLEGVTLGQHLKKKGALPFTEILEIFSQLCKGLQAAHEKGIIHRDLKPDNIFLVFESGEKPFVKILDFGIAKVAQGVEDEEQDLTAANVAFGTPAYMSPEQCKGAKEVDHRSDVYALGIILYKMITNRTPFAEPGEGRMAIMIKQTTQAPTPLSQCVSGRSLPEGLEDFIKRVLSKNPAERPSSCIGFYDRLSKIVKDCWSPALDEVDNASPIYESHIVGSSMDTSQSISRVKTGGVSVVPRKKKASPIIWVVLGVMTVVFGVFLGGLLLPSEQDKIPTSKKLGSDLVLQSVPDKTPQSTPVLTPVTTILSSSIKITLVTDPEGFIVYQVTGKGKVPLGKTPTPFLFASRSGEIKLELEKSGYQKIALTLPTETDVEKTLSTIKIEKKDRTPKDPNDQDTANPFGK